MARTVIHLSPHPDDEIAGMPATLMALRDAGWRVVNVACGLGRPAQHQRRRSEVEEACRRAGFDFVTCDPPLPLSAGDDLAGAEETLVELLGQMLSDSRPRSWARRARTTAITRTSSWAGPPAGRSRPTRARPRRCGSGACRPISRSRR